MLRSIIVIVKIDLYMLSIIMASVIMQSVMAPKMNLAGSCSINILLSSYDDHHEWHLYYKYYLRA
jgi:hypothetical protein